MRVTADMEIMVPKGATIEAHGRYGDFDITDVDGNVEITSDNAGVRLQNIGGDVRIDLRSSDIVRAVSVKGPFDLKGRGADVDLQDIDGQVTITGAYSGVIQFRNLSKPLRFNGQQTDLNIEKLPGQVRMALGDFTASNLVGPVRLTTRRATSRSAISRIRWKFRWNAATSNCGRASSRSRKWTSMRASAMWKLSLPAGAKFDLTGTTARGETYSDYGDALHTDRNGNGGSIRGSSGGPVINLQTEHGKMTVRKATADDKPFAPEVEAPATPVTPAQPLKKVDQ